MSILKAKEFDRLGNQRKLQEYESQIKTLEYKLELLEAENSKYKDIEEELNFFKSNQDSQFTQFESKFTQLSAELDATKEENETLKQTEDILRSKISHISKERNQLLSQIDNIENINVWLPSLIIYI